MKASIVFYVLTLAIPAIRALLRETNAQRFARGLPPLPPKRRQPGGPFFSLSFASY
ncbi:hypothetical protein C8R44DRAFT_618425 [Mycena epipterygia]|nr:hypothetical protein C8R44DRAFT_618425 [Mycena epipterygia]